MKLDKINKEKAKFNGFVTNLASQVELEAAARKSGRARKKGKQKEMDPNLRYKALKTWELGISLGLHVNGHEEEIVNQLGNLINGVEVMVNGVEKNQELAPFCIRIAGDFNSIRRVSERAGRRAESCKRDIAFDGFIRDSGLLDLPLHGRSFTWYKPDASCKSRLDRILLWNSDIFGSMDDKVEKRKVEILKLDLIDDALGLEDWEICKRNEEQA
ncbi:hypothetical protein ACS0TY_011088 [Phlomoides rotata]